MSPKITGKQLLDDKVIYHHIFCRVL